MTTALILLVSGVLIGAGISLILRDSRGRRRRGFLLERDAQPKSEAEAEITIAYDAPAAAARAKLAAQGEALQSATDADRSRPPVGSLASLANNIDAVQTMPGGTSPLAGLETNNGRLRPNAVKPASGRTPHDTRQPLEQEWTSLQPAITAAVDKVNAVLAPVQLSISPTGEPSWSYKNRGYGAYRRVLLGGESVAWLRLELSPEGRVNASVKAHKEDRTDINAAADVSAKELTAARAADLLSQCLKLAASYAARQEPSQDGAEQASKQAWESVDAVVTAALKATNGALVQAGARLVPLAPAAWEMELRRHRMTLSVEVNGGDVARMHIERHPHEMEVAVGVREPQFIDLGRRRRVPIEGMTIHVLAELIASCAWPAIARFREVRPSA